jgi:hypothetical protein
MALHLSGTGVLELALATALSAVRDANADRVAEGEARVHLAHIHLARQDVDSAYDAAGHVWNDASFSSDARGRAGALLARLLLLRDRADEALAVANEVLPVLERARPLGDAEVRLARDEAVGRLSQLSQLSQTAQASESSEASGELAP